MMLQFKSTSKWRKHRSWCNNNWPSWWSKTFMILQ